MKNIIGSFFISLFLTVALPASAEIQFEGWYRVLVNGKHAGFVIQRYEVEPKTKKKTISYFVRFKRYGEVTQQAIRAEADENFKPIKYQNVSDLTPPPMLYEGQFGKKETSVSAYDISGKKPKLVAREPYVNPDQGFLSSFLFPIIDKKGDLKVGAKGTYNGFSEENGNFGTGEYEVVATKTANGVPVFQVADEFQSETIENFVFPGGQNMGARSSSTKTRVYLVRDQSEATAGIDLDEQTEAQIRKFFNGMPEGKKNPVTEAAGGFDAYRLMSEFAEIKLNKGNPAKSPLLTLPLPGTDEKPKSDDSAVTPGRGQK